VVHKNQDQQQFRATDFLQKLRGDRAENVNK